jgi:gliding motility-associated-like protein
LLSSVCIACSFISNAQLCTGSLGDPAVNITFGSGGNTNLGFAPPSAYTYINSSCPNDGYYTIASSTSGCFNNAWHTVTADHTGNGGAFMLVNASYTPGDFFVTTLTGLCPNTTYEFAAWVMNVLISFTGIKPNITFSIETPSGVVLNQFNTGGINATSQPQWQQYGFFFTTTAGNPDIVLRMTNNAPGGIGNDLALDDITFRPCGPVVNSAIQGNSSNKVDVCATDQVNYIFTGNASPGFTSPVFQWQVSNDSGTTWKDIAGASSLTYQRQPTIAGNYSYRLTVAESGTTGITACRIASNVLIVNAYAKPVINAGPDRVIIAGGSTILAATTNESNLTFFWSPPDYLNSTSILNPEASPPAGLMNYLLSAVSQYGCTNEDNVIVKVVAGIFVPTAFTPNNDGKNDTWQIPFLDPQMGATVNVYNRWGQLVYQAVGTTVDWNGTFNGMLQPTATYVYTIHFIDGRKDMKGTVSIIR